MTSNVKYFDGTQTGAPVLNASNVQGNLIALLDAVLINGYNLKTVASLTQSAGTATLTCSGHGFSVGQTLLLAGANEAQYNGEFKVLTITANTLTFAIDPAAPASATGASLSAKVAPLGWTKPYSGTNLAAYRATGGVTKHYLRLDDTVGTYSTKVWAAESMTDVNTGTGIYPPKLSDGTQTTFTDRTRWFRCPGSSATVIDWVLFGDDKFFYFLPLNTNQIRTLYYFGEILSNVSGDQYHSVLNADDYQGAGAPNMSYTGQYTDGGQFNLNPDNTSAQNATQLARSYLQVAGATWGNKAFNLVPGGGVGTYSGVNALAVTNFNPITGGVPLVPAILLEKTRVNRGTLPGMFFVAANAANTLFDKAIITGSYKGKTRNVLILAVTSGQTTNVQTLMGFDITGPFQ